MKGKKKYKRNRKTLEMIIAEIFSEAQRVDILIAARIAKLILEDYTHPKPAEVKKYIHYEDYRKLRPKDVFERAKAEYRKELLEYVFSNEFDDLMPEFLADELRRIIT